MNLAFLEEYTEHHLHDIGQFSEEAQQKFMEECSGFLTTIKDADHDLWEEVMTMSKPKQSDLMRTILEVNSFSILPEPVTADQVRELEEFVGFSFSEEPSEELRLQAMSEICTELDMSEDEVKELIEFDMPQSITNHMFGSNVQSFGHALNKTLNPDAASTHAAAATHAAHAVAATNAAPPTLLDTIANAGHDVGVAAHRMFTTDSSSTVAAAAPVIDTASNTANAAATNVPATFHLANIGAALLTLVTFVRIYKSLKKNIRSVNDWTSDRKTKEASDMIHQLRILVSMIMFGNALMTVGSISSIIIAIGLLGFLMVSIRHATVGVNHVTTALDSIRAFIFTIFKMVKRAHKDTRFSKLYSAMYALERSQLQGCLKSCDVNTLTAHERYHIVRLSLTDASTRDKTPTKVDAQRYIKADCIFACSMRYMISMIAELFAALKSCTKNTSGVQFKIRGDAIGEIRNMQLDAACEPIRAELDSIHRQFTDFLDLMFKSDQSEKNKWRNALNHQITQVMNGQHSRPISVGYSSKTTSSPIVFEL